MSRDNDFEFLEPVREIKSPMDMPIWLSSEGYRDLLGFTLTISESIKGKKSTDDCHISELTQSILNILQTIDNWIDEIPPCDQPQRFGNKAYRDWHKRLLDNSEDLILPVLSDKYKGAVIELKAYLQDSFGNSTRIDYGTGHEACFIFFLICLYKLRLFIEDDHVAIVIKILQKYLKVMRKLQLTYRMEPAGSQGVWGLDDFQFIPYIWGSSQLIDHPTIHPEHIASENIADTYHTDYLFFDCIKFINQVKTGPFAEHSNTLWGISAVQHWLKVNSGLIKMYKVEVLSKFPVVQHFLFGTLISIKKAT